MQIGADIILYAIHQAFAFDNVDIGIRNRASDGVPGLGVAMRDGTTFIDGLKYLIAESHRRNRQIAG